MLKYSKVSECCSSFEALQEANADLEVVVGEERSARSPELCINSPPRQLLELPHDVCGVPRGRHGLLCACRNTQLLFIRQHMSLHHDWASDNGRASLNAVLTVPSGRSWTPRLPLLMTRSGWPCTYYAEQWVE